MKQTKRIISFVLSLVMLLSVCSVFTGVYGAESETVTLNVVGKYDQDSARGMLTLINNFRKSNDAWYWKEDNKTKTSLVGKLSNYVYDYDLERVAMQRAAEIAVECDDDHHRPDGTACWTAYNEYSVKITSVGENVAFTHETAQEAFEDWREDGEDYLGQGHRRSMLSNNFTAIGIAHFIMNGTHYWVQEFRQGSSDTNKVPANNDDAIVPVVAKKDIITRFSLASDTVEDISTAVDETTPLPTLSARLMTKEHWPTNVDIIATVSPIWSTTDPQVAIVAGNHVKGVSAGTTTLKAECSLGASIHKTMEFPVTIIPCNHTFKEEILQEETCTQDGLVKKTCTKCGDVVEEAIPAGHKWVEERVEATCKEDGYVGNRCARCSAFELIETLPKGQHTLVTDKGYPATCTEPGLTDGTHCSVCEQVITPQTVIKATGHQPVTVKENIVPATCTKEGSYTEITYCSVCNLPLSSEEKTIAKLAHNYVTRRENEVPATCTKTGSYTEVTYCSECGDVKSREDKIIPMLAHTKGTPVKENEVPATYSADGSYDSVVYCTECHTELSREKVTVPKLKNGWVAENGHWYYYQNNVMQKGWKAVNGAWYFMDKTTGIMKTGWVKDGAWYYMNPSGSMVTGWKYIGGVWYYFNSSGAMVTGWQKIGGKWYYFVSSGAMVTGWQKVGSYWYYFNSGGDMVTGWKYISGKWYFFNSGGDMRTASLYQGGKTYYFNSSGACTNP